MSEFAQTVSEERMGSPMIRDLECGKATKNLKSINLLRTADGIKRKNTPFLKYSPPPVRDRSTPGKLHEIQVHVSRW